MDPNRLRMFLTLYETLNFTRAAARCHLSLSAVSRAIAQLEVEVGTPLFERDNRRVVPTRAADSFAHYAREALAQWEALQAELAAGAGQLRGALRLYCSVTASYSFLYDILADFRTRHPLIELIIHTGDPALSIERVLQGQEDIAIAARLEVMPAALEFKRIATTPLVMVGPLDHAALPAPEAPDFWQRVPLILAERGVARERLDTWLAARGVVPHIFAQVAGHEAIVSMVSLGFGVGLIPEIVLKASPLANRVRALSVQPELAPYEVGVCVLQSRLRSPLLRAFWASL